MKAARGVGLDIRQPLIHVLDFNVCLLFTYLRPKEMMLPPLRWFLIIFLGWGGFWLAPQRQTAVSGITQPQSGDTLSGVVTVSGTAVHPDYLRYELAFRPDTSSDWVVFAEGGQPVVRGTLAVWDTTVGQSIGAPVFPDGRYQLRLRVVKTDYNYDEYFVTDLVISNSEPTATPTPNETAVALPTESGGQATPGSSFQQATPLPSLTPFATLTPPPTPLGNATVAAPSGEPSGGLVGQVQALDLSRLRQGFWLGVKLTAVLFAAGLMYLLLRDMVRRLWRRLWYQANQRK